MSEPDPHELQASENSTDEESRLIVNVVAPLAAMAATWAVRKVLNSGYKAIRGIAPPTGNSREVSFGAAVTWAAITAASAAVVEVSVVRLITKRTGN